MWKKLEGVSTEHLQKKLHSMKRYKINHTWTAASGFPRLPINENIISNTISVSYKLALTLVGMLEL